MDRLLTALSCAVLAAVAAGCGSGADKAPTGLAGSSVVQTTTGRIRLQVSFAEGGVGRAKPTAIKAIDRVTAYVLNSDGAEVTHADLRIDLADSSVSGEIGVPAQDNLKVVLTYLGGTIVRYLGQDADVDVPLGGMATAEINVHFMGVQVVAPETVQDGDTALVAWTAWVPESMVTRYELDESTRNDFAGAATVYDGPNRRVTLRFEGEGIRYYRARAYTAYGAGPWYSWGIDSVRCVDGGTIFIASPLPADEPLYPQWYEDWEQDWVGGWSVEGDTWEVGVPTSGPGAAYRGRKVAATILAGNYGNRASARLIRIQPFLVPSPELNPRLSFWHWYDTESVSLDPGSVQVRVGTGAWQDLAGAKWGGSGTTWTNPVVSLSAFADSLVQISFRFTSDGSISRSGWYIDEVRFLYGP